ncbi:hypothetical protein AOX55_00003714 [Sinorhizobium fredii CCBAU 25509]|nr:hypothetical protein AOX55_00003714 [Sinorhizobium fredii CCBAU 25509]
MLVQFLALLEEMKTREEILPEFERLLDRCGFDFYGVVRQPKPHENPLGSIDIQDSHRPVAVIHRVPQLRCGAGDGYQAI